MSNNAFKTDKNGAIVDQLANTMAELVEQSDILLDEMKKIKEQDKELEEKEKLNSPKCVEFLGSKYDEFKSSKVISIDDIKEFITAKNELDSIREKRLELEQSAKEVNEKRSILTAQVEEAYEKIVSITKEAKEETNTKSGIYVRSLGRNVEIVDTYIRENREVVDSSLTEIIRTTQKIYDALYQGYSESITKIESEPIDNYSETKSLIGSLNEIIRAQNISIDSQIPLLNGPVSKSSDIEKPVITSEPMVSSIDNSEQPKIMTEPIIETKPIELQVPNSVQAQPLQESTESKENFINLETIMKDNNQITADQQQKEESTTGKVITINVPYKLDPSNKIANSNTKKYDNITNNFKKICPVIVLEKVSRPELNVSDVQSSTIKEDPGMTINSDSTSENEVSANQTISAPVDPIANFLSSSQAA